MLVISNISRNIPAPQSTWGTDENCEGVVTRAKQNTAVCGS